MSKRQSKTRDKRASTEAFKIDVEKHTDGYGAYPLGLKGMVVGQGDSYEQAMTDVKSAICFHIETLGKRRARCRITCTGSNSLLRPR